MKKKKDKVVIFFDGEKWIVIDEKAFKKEEKEKRKQKEKQAKRLRRKEWFTRNLGTILTVTPIAVGAVTAIVGKTTNLLRVAHRRSMIEKEQKLKDLYCYDRSLGHYWQLKRKLSNSDWVVINQRRSKGDSLADILADMDVLKR